MDAAKTSNNLSFKHEKGCFLHRWVLILLIVVAALCIICVGLLVGYLTPCEIDIRSEKITGDKEVKKELPYVRLPRSIIPEHYDVELQPYIIPDNFTFDGKVRILIKVLEPTDNVTLHIHNMTVDPDSVKLTEAQSGDAVEIASTSEDTEKQFYILHLKANLMKDTQYEVSMVFLGSLTDQLAGFYRSSYTDSAGNKR